MMHHLRNCLLVYFFALLLFFLPIYNAFVNAETIYGTPGNDSVTVLSGTIWDGIFGYDGDDTIFIESMGQVASDVQLAAEAIAAADAVAIDAGGGDDQVINNGAVSANAGANALPVDGSPSQATANATGVRAGDGADMVLNSSTMGATATSHSESGDISVTLTGDNQSQRLTTSKATAVVIDGGAGDNQVTNSGGITATVVSEARAPFIYLDLSDTAYADVSV
ncbi:MAG: hypothetical protein PVH99_09465, partial [Desulfobacteraceae bacterium]